MDGDGLLSDDERDADGDGLSNWDEQHGRFTEVWWPAEHDGQNEPHRVEVPEHQLPGRGRPERTVWL